MAVYYGIKWEDVPLSSVKLANQHIGTFTLFPANFSPALFLKDNSTIEQDLIPKVVQTELAFNVPRLAVLHGGNPTRWRIFVLRGSV